MFILDLLLLALRSVVFPNPGMERVFIHSEVPGRRRNRLRRFDRQFHGALFEFGGITFRRGFTHRTRLSRFVMALVSVCQVEYSHITMCSDFRELT